MEDDERHIARLEQLGHDWSAKTHHNSVYSFNNAERTGNLVFVSGNVPVTPEGGIVAGKVGGTVSKGQARDAAELCALECLRSAGSLVNLSDIVKIVSMRVFVNVAPGFNQMSEVAEGASLFLHNLFRGTGVHIGHARAAVGVASLPMDAAVEIEMVIEVR